MKKDATIWVCVTLLGVTFPRISKYVSLLTTNYSPHFLPVSSRVRGYEQEHTTSSPAFVGLVQTADTSQPPLSIVHFPTINEIWKLLSHIWSYPKVKKIAASLLLRKSYTWNIWWGEKGVTFMDWKRLLIFLILTLV